MNKRQAKKKQRRRELTKKQLRAIRRRAIKKVEKALTERTKEAAEEAVAICFWAYVFTNKKIPGENEVFQVLSEAERAQGTGG